MDNPRLASLAEAVERNNNMPRGGRVQQPADELEAPATVAAKPRLWTDIEAMTKFFQANSPPLRVVRASKVVEVFYGFGDASGTGFGSSFDGNSAEKVYYRFGQWCTLEAEESSNFRELQNLIQGLRDFLVRHSISGAEIFLFTDNSVAESAYWKGNSSSRKLFELVLELRILARDHCLILHVIHVSGKRMIAQGTDGLSRADFSEGVMAGQSMTSFVPLHLTCKDRSPAIIQPLVEAMSDQGRTVTLLECSDWFHTAHNPGTYLWTPAPAITDVLVEQLGKARHKRPECLHLIAVPRLMTGRWRKHLGRESDFYFRIPPGCPVWPKQMFEPLLIFVCLPFIPHRPWIQDRPGMLDKLVRSLLEEGLWETCPERGWTLLLKFLRKARTFSGVS